MKFYQPTKSQILFGIIALAIVIRFYGLGQIPLTLNWDEASNAYNAYSILKTGRDEYGNFLPLSSRPFDDYKPGLFMYLNVLTVFILGLTQFAARLPSALLGVLCITASYYLVKTLFGQQKLALLTAFLLTISPWHIQFSRAGFEANVGLCLMVIAFWLFLLGVKKNKHSVFLLSGIFFGLVFYAYHAQRLIVPLLLIVATLIYRAEVKKIPKKFLALFLIIISLSILPFFHLPPQTITGRFQATSGQAIQNLSETSGKLTSADKDVNASYQSILHAKPIVISLAYFENYLQNFDPNFLFLIGDGNFRHHLDGISFLYLFQLPLLVIGAYILVRAKGKGTLFLIIWALLSAVPAMTSAESPHAVRTYTLVVPLTVATAQGIVYLPGRSQRIIAGTILAAAVISIFVYIENYYNHYPQEKASAWQYGYGEAVHKTQQLAGNFDKIIIDSTLEQPYIFWLFYLKYDPATYQKGGTRAGFDKYSFQDAYPGNKRELLVSTKLPEDLEVLETIYYPNGQKAIQLGTTK